MHRGFTLLELLVVLSLASLAVGIVVPAIGAQIAQARFRSQVVQVQDVLVSLPWRARESGATQSYSARELATLLGGENGIGEQLQLPVPLEYDARGLTKGGRVTWVRADGERVTWAIGRNFGDVVRLESP